MRGAFLMRALGCLVVMAVAAGAGFGPPPASWAEESAAAAAPTPWWESVTVNGMVSGSYSYNLNKPASGLNGYRVFDFSDRSFKVDVVELVLQKPLVNAGDAGFRVDLEAGGSIPQVSASAGLFRDADGAAGDLDLQQAYVGYVANVGRGLRFDFGKFVTPMGYELIEGYDGYNDNATRSFLFGYAIPFTHTGLKLSYPFSDKASGMLYLVNGWDNATDNNRDKSVGAQLGLTPCAAFSAYMNFLSGVERPDGSGNARWILDGVVNWKLTPGLSIGLNVDEGREDVTALQGDVHYQTRATWSGLAVYVRFAVCERLALIARGETFRDEYGVRTGLDQRLTGFTLTPELKVAPGLVLRADLRYDHSDINAFESDSGSKDHQTTLLMNALVTF